MNKVISIAQLKKRYAVIDATNCPKIFTYLYRDYYCKGKNGWKLDAYIIYHNGKSYAICDSAVNITGAIETPKSIAQKYDTLFEKNKDVSKHIKYICAFIDDVIKGAKNDSI